MIKFGAYSEYKKQLNVIFKIIFLNKKIKFI